MPQIPHCVLLITSSCCALLKISAVTWRLPYKTDLGQVSLSAVVHSSPFTCALFVRSQRIISPARRP